MESVPVIAVVGPTASGKSALAVALAERLGGEIVSADSMQIYSGLPIGTAQPSEEEKRGIAHHLIGFLDPSQEFNAAQYVEFAKEAIRSIRGRGKLPILAGGTGLYVSSLLHNVRFLPEEEDPELRKSLEITAKEQGIETLLERLKQLDPAAAVSIDSCNQKRVIRCLELSIKTGKTAAQRAEESRGEPSPYNSCMLGLCFADRSLLYDRINRRVDWMLEQGLMREARALFENRQVSRTVLQAIGYKEFFPYFRGEISLETAVETVKRESRRYAKRQMTWFRREGDIHWLEADDPSLDKLLEQALAVLRLDFPFLEL